MSGGEIVNTEAGQSQKKKLQQNERRELHQTTAFRMRRSKTIQRLSLILAILDLSITPVFLIMALTVNSAYFWVLLPQVVAGIALILAFFCAKSQVEARLGLASYLMVTYLFVDAVLAQWEFGANSASVLLYPWLIIVAALIGLKSREIAGITLFSLVGGVSMVVAELGLNLYTPLLASSKDLLAQLFVFVLLSLMLLVGVLALMRDLYQALGESEQRTMQFIETNHSLSQTNQFGKEVASSLNTIVSELGATSRQQVSGAQQQATAVIEVTTSLTELGETARHIALNANRVSSSAEEGFSSANQVREATKRANTTAERGQSAVDSSIQAIEDVRNGITALAERLMTLTDRSRQISSIISLIKQIADETHLLALNAAIESAGSGENGRRFAVVASEVKSLADRSLEATTEVSQVINELQGAVASAVLASEETRKKTFGAVERSYQAGQVITELGLVVDETASSSIQIVEAVEQVTVLAEEIRLATQQQESAVRQIISTMEGVGMVARETASAIGQVSETVSRIDKLSGQLKEVFANPDLVAA